MISAKKFETTHFMQKFFPFAALKGAIRRIIVIDTEPQLQNIILKSIFAVSIAPISPGPEARPHAGSSPLGPDNPHPLS
jgi:hypothetical protein